MSPKFKSVLYPLLAAVFGALTTKALLFASGCGQLSSAQTARVEKFECQARALAPFVDGIYDERELLKDLVAGKAVMAAVVANLGLKADELEALQAALTACDPPLPPPPGEPS